WKPSAPRPERRPHTSTAAWIQGMSSETLLRLRLCLTYQCLKVERAAVREEGTSVNRRHKKKKVPSELSCRPALRRHARHRAVQSDAAGRFAIPLPHDRFSGHRIDAFWHAATESDRDRSLAVAFPLSKMSAPFEAPIRGNLPGQLRRDLLLICAARSD